LSLAPSSTGRGKMLITLRRTRRMVTNTMPTRMSGMLRTASLHNSAAAEENLLKARTFQKLRKTFLKEITSPAESKTREN
jgi:hypothetical protein